MVGGLVRGFGLIFAASATFEVIAKRTAAAISVIIVFIIGSS
jgi:hypothetical protein